MGNVKTKPGVLFNNGKKEKDRFFLENGSLLLQDQLTSCNGRSNPIRSYTVEQLKIATNNFDKTHLTYDGIWSRIYQGSFNNQHILIKISEEKAWHGSCQSNMLTSHDIALSSQLSNHNNILKLLGCCLELQSPALVYDNQGNYQVLSDLLYDKVEENELLSWKNRLRIAHDIANAIVYLHSAFPTPIIHGNLSTKKVAVSRSGTAKLFSFALSVVIPEGKTKVEGVGVSYTREFVDPEYQKTGVVTEKVDVFGFGMLLLVLLTGNKCVSGKAGNLCCISERGRERINEECLDEIVDPRLLREGKAANEDQKDERLLACLKLILRCVQERGEDRPEMIEVAKELRQMMKASDNTSTSSMGP